MKALEKDRTRRYDTASGLADDVERFLKDEPIVARSPSLAYRFAKFARRNRTAVVTSAVVLVSLGTRHRGYDMDGTSGSPDIGIACRGFVRASRKCCDH